MPGSASRRSASSPRSTTDLPLCRRNRSRTARLPAARVSSMATRWQEEQVDAGDVGPASGRRPHPDRLRDAAARGARRTPAGPVVRLTIGPVVRLAIGRPADGEPVPERYPETEPRRPTGGRRRHRGAERRPALAQHLVVGCAGGRPPHRAWSLRLRPAARRAATGRRRGRPGDLPPGAGDRTGPGTVPQLPAVRSAARGRPGHQGHGVRRVHHRLEPQPGPRLRWAPADPRHLRPSRPAAQRHGAYARRGAPADHRAGADGGAGGRGLGDLQPERDAGPGR